MCALVLDFRVIFAGGEEGEWFYGARLWIDLCGNGVFITPGGVNGTVEF